jgi:hypothetical protein
MKVSRDSYYRVLKRYKRRGKASLKPTSRRVPLKTARGGHFASLHPEMESDVL